MNKIPRNILIITVVIALLTSISNYSSSSENIDDLAYVMAVAIDVGTTAKYKISLHLSTIESSATEAIIKPKESSEDSSGGGQESNGDSASSESQSSSNTSEIFTIECNSLDSAINIANTFLNKDITLSHCKVLIISEEQARKNISQIINNLINKVEVRPDCNIIISSISDNEFNSSNKPKLENLISKYYDLTSNSETITAYNQEVELTDFYSSLEDSLMQPYAGLGIISNTSKNSYIDKSNSSLDAQAQSLINYSSQYAVNTIGLAVFKDDKMVGTLSGIETMCHLLIINKFNSCILDIPNPLNSDETISLYLYSAENTKNQVSIVNSSPFVKTKINLSAKILSSNNNDEALTQENLTLIQDTASKYITEQIYNYFNKTSKEFQSDIAGLGRFAIKNFKTTNEWRDYNWLENYQNSTFKVDLKLSIRTGILLTAE